MNRITETDTYIDAMVKLADGNPGAIVCMTKMLKYFEDTIPTSMVTAAFSEVLQTLDTSGTYGPDIWVIWKDECGFDPQKFMKAMIVLQDGYKVSG